MKKTNLYNKVVGLALAALTFTACTDTWDDHYDATSVGDGGTIWESIKQNGDLSNFRKVMEATGYDMALASSQVFTVFAPVNVRFSEVDANEVIRLYQQQKAANIKDKDNRAIKEFVQNHIALYNYSASGKNDSIVMMNGKYLLMQPTMLANSTMLTKNQLKSNGVLFTMEEPVKYYHNVFEYLSADKDIDSIGAFMAKYNQYEFLASKSVPGGIIDGKTWYLDSVKTLKNELFYEVGLINVEDSTYWMVAPTNEVWNKLIPEYEPYFNYDSKVDKRDSLMYTEPRLALLRGTVFSRTKNTDASINDSVLSYNATDYAYRTYKDQTYYQYKRPFDGGGVFYGAEPVDCSNGRVFKSSQWNIDKTQTFLQTIIVEGESRTYLDGVDEDTTDDPYNYSVTSTNECYDKVSQNKYVLVKPRASSAAEVRFKIPNVLSGVEYDIYVVFVPVKALETLTTEDYDVPCKFRASYSFHDADGKQSDYEQLTVPSDYEGYDADVRGSNLDYLSIPGQVDTLLLAQKVVFPTCSWGLRDSQVLLKLRTSLRNADRQNHTFTDRLRIDCVILKPHKD